jgi:hypothetical protein
MPENVSKSHDIFHKARRDFIKLAYKTEIALRKEKDKLTRQLKRTNSRIAKEKDRLMAAEKNLAQKGTAARKKQVKKIKTILAREKQTAKELREAMRPLSEKLLAAKDHVVTARYFERGLKKIDKEIEVYFNKKKAKAAKKKKSVKKKPVKKRSVKTSAVKKKATKKKATKKKATKKKAVKKKAVKKKSVSKAKK